MATGITISILQQYFSRLIAKFLNCTSELLIRHDRGGEIVIFRRWQPAEAAWDAKRKDWLKLVYSSRSVAGGDSLHAPLAFDICLSLNVKMYTWSRMMTHVEMDCTFVLIWRNSWCMKRCEPSNFILVRTLSWIRKQGFFFHLRSYTLVKTVKDLWPATYTHTKFSRVDILRIHGLK